MPAGRPRVLDEGKQREVCALVSAGCGIREAARYVRCAPSTIRREAERNENFHDQLRRATVYAELSPLRAMQQAVSTHWRAAAWMLERTRPERFARRDPQAFRPRQARALAKDLLDIVDSEITDPIKRQRIEQRIAAAIQYAVRDARDTRRTGRNLRRAMQFFAEKDALNDPFADFGFPPPELDRLLQPPQPLVQPEPPDQPSPAESEPPATMRDFARALAAGVRDAQSRTTPRPADDQRRDPPTPVEAQN